MKWFMRLFFLFVVAGVVAGGYGYWEGSRFLATPPSAEGQEVLFDVEPGTAFGRVAEQLQAKGCITNARYFGWLARYKQWDSRLQAGRFALNTGWQPEKVLDQLVNGHPVLYRITLREGLTWWEVGQTLSEAGFVRAEDFQTVITDPAFLRHYGIPFASAEGFLLPNTYLLKKPDSPTLADARSIAGRLVDTFWQKTAPLWPGGQKPKGAELQRLVTLASIVERETAIPAERPRVAGVYANRLKANMLLQADPTVIYGIGPAFDGNLRRSQLGDANNLYNTYQRPGLPPGPICSPGVASLRAALQPEVHDFYYFVAKSDGGEHAFSVNLSEHNKAVRQYLESRKKNR
ncbi:MAG: endolytic transglycosylase MltG [Desulfovibrionaceae bacterium]